MSRRRGSATALNASEVVAARAIGVNIYSHIGICKVIFSRRYKNCLPEFASAHFHAPFQAASPHQRPGYFRGLDFPRGSSDLLTSELRAWATAAGTSYLQSRFCQL